MRNLGRNRQREREREREREYIIILYVNNIFFSVFTRIKRRDLILSESKFKLHKKN